MFLTTIASSFCLLSAPTTLAPLQADPAVEEAFQVIRQYHLDSAEGRIQFLTQDVASFAHATEQLNQEVQALARRIEQEQSQTEIVALTQALTAKMGLLLERLPAMQAALSLDDDLVAIDAIFNKQGFLDDSEKEILLRVASLCNMINQY